MCSKPVDAVAEVVANNLQKRRYSHASGHNIGRHSPFRGGFGAVFDLRTGLVSTSRAGFGERQDGWRRRASQSCANGRRQAKSNG